MSKGGVGEEQKKRRGAGEVKTNLILTHLY